MDQILILKKRCRITFWIFNFYGYWPFLIDFQSKVAIVQEKDLYAAIIYHWRSSPLY